MYYSKYREVFMKLITAIIKPDKVEALRQALTGVDIQGLTIVEAKG